MSEPPCPPAFEPVPVRARADGWTPERQRRFIAALTAMGVVAAAARAVGKSPISADRLRKRAGAQSFAAAWDTAVAMAGDRAFEQAMDRAINGVEVPRFYKGRQVAIVRRPDYSPRAQGPRPSPCGPCTGNGRPRRLGADHRCRRMNAICGHFVNFRDPDPARRSGTIRLRNRSAPLSGVDARRVTREDPFPMFNRLLTAAAMAATLAGAAAPAVAQSRADDDRFRAAQARFDREYQIFRQEADRYASVRGRVGYVPQGYSNARPAAYDDDVYYDPSRDYRAGPQYSERTLSSDDRVYAGTDGRYYCRRSDGTTGLIVGAAGGGILGNVIDGGRSRTVGTLLGAAIGGLAGRAVDQNNAQVRCR